jgi:hypothetical protein
LTNTIEYIVGASGTVWRAEWQAGDTANSNQVIAATNALAGSIDLQQVTDNGNTTTQSITTSGATIDASNTKTNTYGGYLGIRARSSQDPYSTATGLGSFAMSGGSAVGDLSFGSAGGSASGRGAFAMLGDALGDESFAFGAGCEATANKSFAMGDSSVASHVESWVWGADNGVSLGDGTWSIYPTGGIGGAYVDGTNLTTHIQNISAAHVTLDNVCDNGSTTDQRIGAGGLDVTDSGSAQIGGTVSASGAASLAAGQFTIASGNFSVALGNLARSTSGTAFSWSGIGGTDYNDHGAATFNVRPGGGADGFYIGETNLTTTIYNLGDPRWVNVSGDTMTGNLNMGGNNITNIGVMGVDTNYTITESEPH